MGQLLNKSVQSDNRPISEQSEVFEDVLSSNTYNDDEKIQIKQKKVEFKQNVNMDINKCVHLSVESLTKAIKLSASQTQTLAVQAQIKTDNEESKNNETNFEDQERPNVDLICVIDKSGSMSGEKIELVRKTLQQLGEYLKEGDRLGLIIFDQSAKRILPLTCMSKKNQSKVLNVIKTIGASGGTSITSGMNLAFKMIKERKFKNDVTSIFLLSDGQDSSAESGVRNLYSEYKIEDNFTINCFGFGADHDPVLMNKIAQQGDGNFYYVEKLDQVDEMFVDSLGALFSVVAENVRLEIKINTSQEQNKIFSDVTINKTYGDMWKYDQTKNLHYLQLTHLLQGTSKDYIFEVSIPPINQKLNDHQRNASFIECNLIISPVGKPEEKVVKKSELQLSIYNEDENIVPEINDHVQLNFVRVQGAEAIQKAQKLAEQGNFLDGQAFLEKAEKEFLKLKPENQKQLVMLEKDIKETKVLSSNQQKYQQEGKMKLQQNARVHMEQRSKAVNLSEDIYQNSFQKQMVSHQQFKKK